MNKILLQLLLALLGTLFLLYSRIDLVALPLFVVVFYLMVYQTFKEKSIFGLTTIAAVASLVLALRFRYLTWGDPWNEYAMILRLIEYGSLSKDLYPSQQPVMHLSIAYLAMATEVNAMALQKFVVPLFSSLSIVLLYKFTKDYFGDKELGFFAGLLLLVGTPYLHWTTQAVRESMGVPMLLMAIYFSYKAIISVKSSNLLASFVIVAGLILTHNFSTAIFIISWLSFSITYVYFLRESRSPVPSMLITLFTLIAALAWWSATEAPTTGEPYANFVNALQLFLPDNPLVSFIILLVVLYVLPSLFSRATEELKGIVEGFLEKRVVQGLVIFISLFVSIMAINLVLGKSFLVLHYPAPMMFNGIIMILLGLAGIYFFLNLRGIPVLTWAAALALAFVLSTLGVLSFGDPLRFIEYLYIPASIIAGAGLKQIFVKIPSQGLKAGMVAVFASVSLVTAFPSIVFWGTPFEKGNVLYDDRSWVIQHQISELKAIKWMDQRGIKGNLSSDNYVYYASQWINDDISLENRVRIGSSLENPGKNYYITTERMKKYAEFAEGMMGERRPLNDSEIKNLNSGTSLIYDGGSAKVYYSRK